MSIAHTIKHLLAPTVTLAVAMSAGAAPSSSSETTVVLVHGAFADSSSWNAVVPKLQAKGLRVVSAANPLRSISEDARYVGQLIDSIKGPVVLVGHSYGGAVISSAAAGRSNVKALVYVAAFIPDVEESALALAHKYPGGTLGEALGEPVALPDGGKDLYIQQSKFHQQFAADVPTLQARQMAATQRPIAEAALTETAKAAAWKQVPSWSIYGTGDKNIPPAAMRFMSERAKARRIVAIDGASHVVMVSKPDAVADLIVEATGASRS
jgi:pimeloyl-ACP methyl ester carboxylesterase